MFEPDKFSEARNEKARELLAEKTIRALSEDTFLVPSQSRNMDYIVKRNSPFSCNCPDFQTRCKDKGLYCKHIMAVVMYEKLKQAAEGIGGRKDASPN